MESNRIKPNQAFESYLTRFRFLSLTRAAMKEDMDQVSVPNTPAAPTRPEEPAGRGSLSLFAWVFLALLILYPLSTGPVLRFMVPIQKYEPLLRVVYGPLEVLCRHFDPAREFFVWYIGVWEKKDGNVRY
jgi:hypothetical protein